MRPFLFPFLFAIAAVNNQSHSLAGLDLLASAVLVLDADGCIAYANPAAENLLESSLKVMQHQRLTEMFLNGDKLQDIFTQAVIVAEK